ncbi:MAG: response regulator [Proteobacteria bacterium]|nr:response regulator [Pseudomonadota bacterium]
MNEHVLIVEDEKDTVELLKYNLEKEGYKTEVAYNGEDALKAYKQHRPDLVLLDIMMPGIDGWEVCRELRRKNRSIPVIMLTALSTEDERIKGLTIGADDYIPKPFSVRELLLKVKRFAEKESFIRGIQSPADSDTLDYIVHELKNSLISLEGYSSLAMKKGDSGRYLPYIKDGARHMGNLLNDVSLLSMLEKGEMLPLKSVSIMEEVKRVVDIFQEEAVKSRVDLSILNTSAATITGNATAVRQALLNLVSNAVKYNLAGGRVMVWLDDEAEFVKVRVKDTGIGIPPEEMPRIFDKRYRVRGGGQAKGNGLGLYIVDLLMKAMGGEIDVASKEGHGSTFTVSFRKV